jgi:hypothetical protein
VQDDEPAGANVPSPHWRHVDAFVAAVAALAVPGGHCVHTDAPSAFP